MSVDHKVKASSRLPSPDPHALERSNRLLANIREEITRGSGSIPFDRYMELALYAPDLGYYAGQSEQFGARGDFVTAPEISPLFAQALATQCVAILQTLGGGDLLELGAGSGRLAADLLDAMAHQGRLPDRYYIFDPSAALRARQQDYLSAHRPQWRDRVVWLDEWPQDLRGVAIANEVLDALPVRCFRTTPAGILERRVTLDSSQDLAWCEREAEAEFLEHMDRLGEGLLDTLPPGYCSECHPHVEPWIARLAEALREGVALLIDYGYPRTEYYHWQRDEGTLICHYRHHAHSDPFFLPGAQDLSASIDFTTVAEAAEATGMQVLGYATQAHFILTNALEAGLPTPEDAQERLQLAQEIKRLTLPSEMGDRFQIMALGQGYTQPLRRLALRDMRFRL